MQWEWETHQQQKQQQQNPCCRRCTVILYQHRQKRNNIRNGNRCKAMSKKLWDKSGNRNDDEINTHRRFILSHTHTHAHMANASECIAYGRIITIHSRVEYEITVRCAGDGRWGRWWCGRRIVQLWMRNDKNIRKANTTHNTLTMTNKSV